MGAATAREMHNKGYRLALMSPSESCELLADELGGVAVRGRAENADNLQACFDLAMDSYGRIDSLLIHVGGPPKGDLLEISDADWEKANQMTVMPVIAWQSWSPCHAGAGRRLNREYHYLFCI